MFDLLCFPQYFYSNYNSSQNVSMPFSPPFRNPENINIGSLTVILKFANALHIKISVLLYN